MKRFIMVLSLMGLMVAMIAVSAMPAFAAKGGNGGGATVQKTDPCVVSQQFPEPGTCQTVETPSGNVNGSFHVHHA